MGKNSSFINRLFKDIEPVIRHAIGMLVTIFCIWLFYKALGFTLGRDAKLFDYVPILYISHAGDTLAFLRFFIMLLKELRS